LDCREKIDVCIDNGRRFCRSGPWTLFQRRDIEEFKGARDKILLVIMPAIKPQVMRLSLSGRGRDNRVGAVGELTREPEDLNALVDDR
jgi:hypothetical protein